MNSLYIGSLNTNNLAKNNDYVYEMSQNVQVLLLTETRTLKWHEKVVYERI